MSPQPKTIVITGCSTGFGRVTALHLARQGWQVFATVRREADAASLTADAKAQGSLERLAPILCDIVQAQQVEHLARSVKAATPRLDALVNNAGTAFPGPLELLPPAELRAQLDVNVVAQLAVTQPLLPLLKAARGTIINVSSIGGRIAYPVLGAYGMSKFALEVMSDVLRMELAPSGVRVVVIEPGSSPTAIWETGRKRGRDGLAALGGDAAGYGPLIDAVENRSVHRSASGFPPERFAETVEKILNSPSPRARYQIPQRLSWLILLRQLIPDRLWDRLVRSRLNW